MCGLDFQLTEVVNETREIEESNAKQTAEVAKANEALDARESELEPKVWPTTKLVYSIHSFSFIRVSAILIH